MALFVVIFTAYLLICFRVLIHDCDIFHAVCELLEEGVAAIFGPVSPHTRGIVASTAARYDVPHIEYVYRKNEKLRADAFAKSSSSMTINVFPDSEMINQVCCRVTKTMRSSNNTCSSNWKKRHPLYRRILFFFLEALFATSRYLYDSCICN